MYRWNSVASIGFYQRYQKIRMKKISILVALLLVLLPSLSKADKIEFEHSDWKTTLAKAAKENKFVFVDAYTTWCGPCKWMAANTFTDPAVAAFFNKNFVNAKIDMERGEGLELAKLYAVRAYPTLLFVNAEGKLIHTEIGAKDAAGFLAIGKKVIDPSFVSLVSMAKQFEQGNRDREFLKDYLLRLSPGTADAKKVLTPFKEGMAGDGLLDEGSWEVFKKYFRKPDSEYAKYFLAHLKDFQAKFGEKPVELKANRFYFAMATDAIRNDDRAALKKAQEAAANSGLITATTVAASMDISWYQQKGELDNYVKAIKELFKIDGTASPESKNRFAWYLYENSDNKKQLKTGLKWINEALNDPAASISRYAMLDTKAMLQLKLGKTNKGIETANMAIEVAKESGEDYSATEEEMAKYKK